MLDDSPTKLLVINEWLFQDIKGENGQSKRRETARFLTQFAQGRDKFAVLQDNDNPWMKKSNELMTHGDARIRLLSKQLRSLTWNPDKCKLIQPEYANDAAPDEAVEAADCKDKYLIRTYYAADADLLVTTDEGLLCAFSTRQDVEVVHRDSFLEDYLNS